MLLVYESVGCLIAKTRDGEQGSFVCTRELQVLVGDIGQSPHQNSPSSTLLHHDVLLGRVLSIHEDGYACWVEGSIFRLLGRSFLQ